MNEKLNQYGDLFSRLVAEMVACSPDAWKSGVLTIDSDGSYVGYRLRNEDGAPGNASISQVLRELIDELCVRMAGNGEAWSRAVLQFEDDDGNIKFDTSFAYEGRPGHEPDEKRIPWWKFWV